MKFSKELNRMIKKYNSMNVWKRLLIILAIGLIGSISYHQLQPVKEGFVQKEKFLYKEGEKVYDDFYAEIYDVLMVNDVKTKFEIGEITKKTGLTEKSKVLDIGTKTGDVVNALSKKGIKAVGIDKSEAMIKRSKEKHGNHDYRVVDPNSSIAFPESYFTHITCLTFMIYTVKDKQTLLQNCYRWLKPGGTLVLHLVNRDMFDPILSESNPINFVSPQKYAKKRITKSYIKFKDFEYNANYQAKNSEDKAYFIENIVDDKTKHTRKNKHVLYIPEQKKILSLAKSIGFILKHKIDLVHCEYEYQYLYILYKP
tara:strand:+ start:3095 stop:4030 length:936 start_codon:yes stop_codon:yes gene_type:complete